MPTERGQLSIMLKSKARAHLSFILCINAFSIHYDLLMHKNDVCLIYIHK